MEMRKELQNNLFEMLAPLKQHLTRGKTAFYFGGYAAGYGMHIAGMEGLLRVLWGLTPYWAGGGTGAEEWKDIYLEAVRNGTDREHEEYWGDFSGGVDQKIVEMAALSLNLLWTPQVIWDRLSGEEKRRVADWMLQVNRCRVPDNNWNFFVVMVNLAMKKHGMNYDQKRMEECMARYEAFYLSNGWYADGERPQKDYYVSFAIHYYTLLYAMFMEKEDPERCRVYKERSLAFAKTFIYWFDERGRALPYGRSLTYRFAQAAFWSAFAMVFGEACPAPGRVRGLILRHMRFWLNQPIFDNGNVLTTGYCYPNLNMSEGYNSPGSPYWSFKTFLCLGLPEDHIFWKDTQEEFPKLEHTKLIPECNMLMQHFGTEAVALVAGQYPAVVQTHSEAKYSKFAYSTVFGFSVPRSSETVGECAPDSMLAFEVNGKLYVRKKYISFSLTQEAVYSTWSPVEGITVEMWVKPQGRGHRRGYKVTAEKDCRVYDCGFAYPFSDRMEEVLTEDTARAQDGNGYSLVTSEAGRAVLINAAPNTNLVFPLTRIPAMEQELTAGVHQWETYCEAAMRDGTLYIGKGDCYELQAE